VLQGLNFLALNTAVNNMEEGEEEEEAKESDSDSVSDSDNSGQEEQREDEDGRVIARLEDPNLESETSENQNSNGEEENDLGFPEDAIPAAEDSG